MRPPISLPRTLEAVGEEGGTMCHQSRTASQPLRHHEQGNEWEFALEKRERKGNNGTGKNHQRSSSSLSCCSSADSRFELARSLERRGIRQHSRHREKPIVAESRGPNNRSRLFPCCEDLSKRIVPSEGSGRKVRSSGQILRLDIGDGRNSMELVRREAHCRRRCRRCRYRCISDTNFSKAIELRDFGLDLVRGSLGWTRSRDSV